jgi:hypothetical protein
MSNQFFMPLGKSVWVCDTNNEEHAGIFEGLVNIGGLPFVYLTYDAGETTSTIEEKLIPINQVVNICHNKNKVKLL